MARFGRLLCTLGLLTAWNARFVAASHSQKPFSSFASDEVKWAETSPSTNPGEIEVDAYEWDFATAPPANSTAHLVFSTVQNLLQHWPNTRYRNGHNLVPGTVPVGTLLYHGTYHNELPDRPDWVATDPEHSHLFCASLVPDAGCWHATLVATRPLKVLYFDGSSAAKMIGGPMDAQDLVVWDAVRPEKTFAEKERITELCFWGKKVGLDGFVRMEMDFEIMLCDFTNGVDVVSILNLSGASQMRGPLPPPPRKKRTQFSNFRVVEAGSWHNAVPGETRIHLDYTRLISFYDTTLFPSLVQAREGQSRVEHRLDGLSKADAKVLRKKLEKAVLGNWEQKSSIGFDWKSLLNTVTERYAERLEMLAYMLNNTVDEPRERGLKAHRHLKSILAFYTLHSAVPPNSTASTGSSEPVHKWAQPVFTQCATTHTRWLEQSPSVSRRLSESERLLLRSVNDVQKEICRVLVGMWAEGVELGMLNQDDDFTETNTSGLTQKWLRRTEDLMKWLDWSYWLRCRPECSYEEMCYLPTWPFFKFPGRPWPPRGVSRFMDKLRSDFANDDDPDDDDEEYKDPQPRCIRRIEPFSLGRIFP